MSVGHEKADCNINRVTMGIDQLTVEEAWSSLENADKEKDVDDIKKVCRIPRLMCTLANPPLLHKAIVAYAKAFPELTFPELESGFRDASMNTYLIAKEQQVSDTHIIVNLQGKGDQTYVVSIQFSNKPRRAKFAEGWPNTPEDNMVRLAEAGFPMDRMVPKCDNCGRKHILPMLQRRMNKADRHNRDGAY
jgi:hypothetical protein